MKLIVMTFLLFLQYTGICLAQPAILKFCTDQKTHIDLYEPIDLSHQQYITTKQFAISPDVEIQYQIPVSDFKIVLIKINGKKTALILSPNDKISLNYQNNNITISGANAEGQIYYNTQFIWQGTLQVLSKLQYDIIQCDDYTGFDQHFEHTMVSPMNKVIDSLRNNNFISSEFSSILHREVDGYLYSSLISSLRNSYLNKTLTKEQIRQIQALLNDLYEQFAKNDDVLALRFNLGGDYLSGKYELLYKKMSEEEKNQLCGEYGRETFGPYAKWLLAPDSVQMSKLSYALWIQHTYAANELNAVELLKYLQAKFPKSDAVTNLSMMYDNHKNTANINGPEYILTPIESLKDLSTTTELSEKYCLIDLWATWCLPCRQEFSHHKNLRELLENYANIALIYISIDEPKSEQQWRKMIEQLNLRGFHLLAGSQLIADIKEKVFCNDNVVIPRYILLSPTGEILNADMPRTDAINDLQQSFDKYVK